jgi:hypothetical protein
MHITMPPLPDHFLRPPLFGACVSADAATDIWPGGIHQFGLGQNLAWTFEYGLEKPNGPLADGQRFAVAQQSAVGVIEAKGAEGEQGPFHGQPL